MEKTATNFTFKLCFGDEIRRVTVLQGTTTFTELETMANDITPSAVTKSEDSSAVRLQWTDSDGDVITLRSQSDLDECFAYLASTSTTSLKISIILPSRSSSSSSSSSVVPFAPFAHDSARLLEAEPPKVDYRTRHHLERMNEKMKYKEQKWLAELERLKLDPHYNEKEHLRQLEVLQGEGIVVYPLVNMLIAKRIVWNNQRAGQSGWWFSWQGWWSSIWEGNGEAPSTCSWASKMTRGASPRALQQVQTLREHQMPTGWPVVAYLGMVDKMAAAAQDPVIVSQLEQVKDIQHVPEPLKVKVLLDFNEEMTRRSERCCRRHRGRRGWW